MNNEERGVVAEPLLDRNIGLNYAQTMTPEEKVNYLVQNLRLTLDNHKQLHVVTGGKYLDYKWYPFQKNEYDIKKDNLLGEGEAIVDLLRRLNWEKEGISFEKYDIKQLSVFYSESQDELKNKLRKITHSISIVTIEDKKYIVDCAYRQFFPSQNEKQEQNSERIDLSEICLKDERRKEVAEQVLKYGWIEATPENIKKYMDMFIENLTRGENINFPTEQDYIKNFKGQIITGDAPERNQTGEYNINDALGDYYWNKRNNEENRDKKECYGKVRSILKNGNRSFSIIEKQGKYYIKGNIDSEDEDKNLDNDLRQQIYGLFEKAQRGELVFTGRNLKAYLDALVVLISGDKCIERPTIEEYNKILGIGALKKCGTVESTYIIDSQPYIIDNYGKNQFHEKMSAEEKLTSIVQKERQFLMKSRNLMEESLQGDCEDSTARVSLDCASKGFTNINYLSPGSYLDNGAKGHNCTITTLDDKNYLIDCTYRQFFTKRNENDNPRYIYDI